MIFSITKPNYKYPFNILYSTMNNRYLEVLELLQKIRFDFFAQHIVYITYNFFLDFLKIEKM